MTTQIKLQNGRWLFNDKTFEECNHQEKILFNRFFKQGKNKKQGTSTSLVFNDFLKPNPTIIQKMYTCLSKLKMEKKRLSPPFKNKSMKKIFHHLFK